MTELQELARQAAQKAWTEWNTPENERRITLSLQKYIADAVYTVVASEYEKEIARVKAEAHVTLTRAQAEWLLESVDPIDGGRVDAAEMLNLPTPDEDEE